MTGLPNMATISENADIAVLPLSGKRGEGKEVLVDRDLFESLSQHKWYLNIGGYVVRTKYTGGGSENPRYTTIFLHKLVAKGRGVTSSQVDHTNLNTLDNTWANLRPATISQNMHNKRTPKNNHSGYKGVCWSKFNKKWMAATSINKKRYYLGYFATPEEAALRYNNFVKQNMGQFARLNDVKAPSCQGIV